MLKTVDIFVYPDDTDCKEVRDFLDKQEVRVNVHDIKKEPLRLDEITRLMRHFNLKHFLNPDAKGFAKHHLNNTLPPRDELYKLMADDNDLIRKPIIVAGRLMVVGANISKIMEMLQIRSNGNGNGNGSDPSRK